MTFREYIILNQEYKFFCRILDLFVSLESIFASQKLSGDNIFSISEWQCAYLVHAVHMRFTQTLRENRRYENKSVRCLDPRTNCTFIRRGSASHITVLRGIATHSRASDSVSAWIIAPTLKMRWKNGNFWVPTLLEKRSGNTSSGQLFIVRADVLICESAAVDARNACWHRVTNFYRRQFAIDSRWLNPSFCLAILFNFFFKVIIISF